MRLLHIDDTEYPVIAGTHRAFLSDTSRFKQVLDFKDETVEHKIHQTFRAQYLKDVVFARILEEANFSTLNSIVMFNQVEILNYLCQNHALMSELYAFGHF